MKSYGESLEETLLEMPGVTKARVREYPPTKHWPTKYEVAALRDGIVIQSSKYRTLLGNELQKAFDEVMQYLRSTPRKVRKAKRSDIGTRHA